MSVTDIHLSKTGKVSDKWESYLHFYDTEFSRYKHLKLNLLEIGIQNGGSLETWAEYFPFAKHIIGVDIDPKCANLTFSDERICVHVADAAELDLDIQLNIIIDDGSHTSSDIVRNFQKWWPRLLPGGLYVVEDFHTMWMPGYGSGALDFFQDMVIDLNTKRGKHKDVCRLEFRNSLVLLQKGSPELGQRLVTGSSASVNPAVLGLGRRQELPLKEIRTIVA